MSVGMVNEQSGEGDPVQGGTLTFGSYSSITTLDPSKTPVAGSVGGTELGAIYDSLLRYDPLGEEFVPKLAESMSPNSDFKTWILKLREGVTFSDGSPFDSQAVKWSLDRYVSNQGPQSSLYSSRVASVDTPDASTVVFHLTDPWTGIQTMLATGPGMIVAPSSESSEQFSPIGAGAFALEKFAPYEELVLAARPDYYAGKPNLERLRIVSLPGSDTTVDSLVTGGLDVAHVRASDTLIPDLIDQGYPGFLDLPSLSAQSQINMAPGRPGADIRVRQALALAVDPEALDLRINDGNGLPGQEIFQESSRWHNDVGPIGFDPAKAKELLDEAKSDGYDGKISLVSTQDPVGQNLALALQSMLNAVGFDFQIKYANSVADVVKTIFADRDFDLAGGALNLPDADPFERLYGTLKTGSQSNASGYSDAEMDSLLDKLGAATTDHEKKAVLAQIQERVNETVPWQTYGVVPILNVWGKNVHGVQQSMDGIMLFDSTWKG
ncbi:ABC transporter substrate-binding protein [Rhodococcus globerulus]|uniref:ABC transporter substrate-binding protein n=1 Tax=Rhodococcus globerulus TaxID=33008 RepID=UPI00301A7F61